MPVDRSVAEAVFSIVPSVRAAIPSVVHIGLYLPDSAGRLRPARLVGERIGSERRRTALRRSALESVTHAWLDLDRPAGCCWLALPLAFERRAFGVLSVAGPRRAVRRQFEVLEAITAQAGALLAVSETMRERRERLSLGLACTAHELRIPILAAKAAIEGALHDGVSQRDSSDLLRGTQRELAHLSALIDDLLRWSVEGAPLDETPVDLVRLTREAVASCTWQTGDGRVRISAPDTGAVWVRADRAILRTALVNLVRNALSYAPDGTEVEVELQTFNGGVRLDVRDDGPGIPVSDREAIFDPLVRGRNAHRSTGNHGLGLFIARRIVEAHGGELSVASDKGTTFAMELPSEKRPQMRAS